jgi:hypothetical protein
MLVARFFLGIAGCRCSYTCKISGLLVDTDYSLRPTSRPWSAVSSVISTILSTVMYPCHASRGQYFMEPVRDHSSLVLSIIALIGAGFTISKSLLARSYCLPSLFTSKRLGGSVLLSRKAKALNRYYESFDSAGYYGFMFSSDDLEKQQIRRIRWKIKSDEECESIAAMITLSCCRPFRKRTTFVFIAVTMADQLRSSIH